MYKKIIIVICFSCSLIISNCHDATQNAFRAKRICIDPGHGGTAETDSFRVGPTGEREEWINIRVAQNLADMLRREGAEVILTRTDDNALELRQRAELAKNHQADLFISIHHNATADTSVNFPIIYFHGNASENMASAQFGHFLAQRFQKNFYAANVPVSLVSDYVIFPSSGTAVLRYSYGIPGVIGEASFFSNPGEEHRLKQEWYNKKEAEAYFLAIKDYFKQPQRDILPKHSLITLPSFAAFQEAERMNPIALNWYEDYELGKSLVNSSDKDSLKKAEELLIRSIRSFPDSWIARAAHEARSQILNSLDRKAEADTALMRIKEFYVVTSSMDADL